MNIVLFDDQFRANLLPLTYTRPVSDLRVGIFTIKEKWEKRMDAMVSTLTLPYLSEKFPLNLAEDNVFINGAVLPNNDFTAIVRELAINEAIVSEDNLLLAYRGATLPTDTPKKTITSDVDLLRYPEDIFSKNGAQIELDWEVIINDEKSKPLSNSNKVTGEGDIFIHQDASVEGAILNPDGGKIYVGPNATIMEGCLVRGSLALCQGAQLKLGAKIYGPTTVGPYSKVGGEVNNSVIWGYSNKGHDGFLGNSVIGQWCNLGADTNTSNLKNNYAEVKLWDYSTGRFRATGKQFCGLMMGDHSKCGINTMFNTGTVVGVSCNIFGSGFPRNYVPSFAWGGSAGFSTYQTRKAFETVAIVMSRRNLEFDGKEQDILNAVFDQTSGNRFWEKSK